MGRYPTGHMNLLPGAIACKPIICSGYKVNYRASPVNLFACKVRDYMVQVPVYVEKETNMIHTFEDTGPTLEQAQEIVGGYVEMVHSPTDPDIQILVNEEGLLKELPFNEEATKMCGTGIVGPAIVLKGNARWT